VGDPAALAFALGLACAAVLLLPGLVLLRLAEDPSRGGERLALAIGASICAAPLALLATSLAGLPWTRGGVFVAYALLAVVALGRPHRRLPDAPALAALGVAFVALAVRAYQARGLAVPLWVDGYHHTLIAELVLRAGTVPTSFRPFIDVDGFYYHFGFHALAAEVAWLSGARTPQAVLWIGQAVNAATALTLWLLALRLTGSRWAAAACAAVPAGLFHFPAYFLTWGRYTQMAALAALPAAVCLLQAAATADRRRAGRAVLLAAVVSAGLVLTHYRVAVIYALCAAVIAAGALRGPGRAGRLLRLAAVAGLAALLAAPWLLGPLRAGAGHLAAATEAAGAERAWWAWSSEVNDVPAWLFTIRWNAPLMVAGALGLAAALCARPRPAAAVVAVLALASLVFVPEAVGLPANWMLPRFAAAIAAFVPVALGVGFLVQAGERLAGAAAARRPGGALAVLARSALARPLAALMVVGAATAGAWSMRDIVNPVTVIASPVDAPAYAWVRAHLPAEARVLVRAVPWHLGACRGIDGGYWLPLLADRATTMPASFYTYGEPADVVAVGEVCAEVAKGDALGNAGLDALMVRTGADWVYVGTAPDTISGAMSAVRLRAHPGLVEALAIEGVSVFCRVGAPGCPPP